MPPVCVGCKREMEPAKNGVWWVKMHRLAIKCDGVHTLGLKSIVHHRPYKATACDRWHCPNCGHQLLTGFAPESVEVEVSDFLKVAKASGDEIVYEEV